MSKRLKLALGFFTYSMTLFVLLGAGGLFWLSQEFSKPGPLAEETLFTVERGQGVYGIAGNLKDSGAIPEPLLFRAGARILGADDELKAGEYSIPARASMKDILTMMREGDVFQRAFTIREGLTSYEIVQILKNIEELSGAVTAIPAEGVLLPNTYDYRLEEDRNAILQRLENEMEQVVLPACGILLEKIAGSTLSDMLDRECPPAPAPLKTVRDVLTLASIVEKETGIEEERRRVAGVFFNRLRRGIPLQTDPTVIYAITKGEHKNEGKGPLGRRLLKKDLEIDSPYNTYKNAGLPPGPIANPGRASIEAVLNPEEHDYIYFVADGSGGHVFAKTLTEHNTNVAKWRQIRREQGN